MNNSKFINAILTLMLSSLLHGTSQAQIYVWTDENGNKVYSDDPSQNKQAEVLEVEPTNILSFPEVDENTVSSVPEIKESQGFYSSFSISSPANDSTIRDNSGTVEVSITTSPALAQGDTIELWLDNTLTSPAKGNTSFVLSNIDRGSHSLTAKLYNAQGKLLLSSPGITFHMHRFAGK